MTDLRRDDSPTEKVRRAAFEGGALAAMERTPAVKHAPKAAWIGLASAGVALVLAGLGWVYGYGRLSQTLESHINLRAHGPMQEATAQTERKVERIETNQTHFRNEMNDIKVRQQAIITSVEKVEDDVEQIKIDNAAQTEILKSMDRTLKRIEEHP